MGRTIDLRGRIDGRTSFSRKVVEATEDDLEDEDEDKVIERKEKLLMREHKIQKLLKKQEVEKLLYKAEKKAKKKEEKRRLKSQVTAVLHNADLSSNVSKKSKSRRVVEELPSASDYSDLESPNEDDSTINVISRTDRGGTLQSDLASVAKTSAKMRLGGGMEDRRRVLETGADQGALRSRMKDKRERIERQSYAARVLGDLMGGSGQEGNRIRSRISRVGDEEERKPRKRSSEQLRVEESSDGDERKRRKRGSDQMRVEESSDEEKKVKRKKKSVDKDDSPIKVKKKKKSEKKEKKKSKKSKKIKTADDINALQMAQEYEPIRSRKLKIKKKEEEHDDSLSLDTSKDALGGNQDKGHQGDPEETGDVMKDLDDFLND